MKKPMTSRHHPHALNQRGRWWMIELKKVEVPKKNIKQPEPDPLILELEKVETQLRQWLAGSEANAELFRNDPIAALRAAGVDIEDETMMELEMIAASIARKLR